MTARDETPITDAAAFPILSRLQSGTEDVVEVEVARELERALRASQAECERLRKLTQLTSPEQYELATLRELLKEPKRERDQLRAERDLTTSQLLAVGSALSGDDKGEMRDHPRWTPTLDAARQLRARLARVEAAEHALRDAGQALVETWDRDTAGWEVVEAMVTPIEALRTALAEQEPPR